jgi:hypothetical protein
MKILKGFLNLRGNSVLPKKYLLILLFPLFVFLIGVNCNDKQESDPGPIGIEQNKLNKLAATDGSVTQSISSGLSSMYLLNFNDTAKNQLSRLISDESYKKLFFQSYLTKNGQLTLVAFAGKENGKEFNPGYEVLGLVNDHGTQDLRDKEVFLGDQTLAGNGFKMLKDAINKDSRNDTTKNYVVFSPELKRFGNSYIVEYSIRFTNTLDGFDVQLLPARSGRLNPSPPY